MKSSLFVGIVSGALLLGACSHHQNPLMKVSKSAAAQQLLTASLQAEKQLKLSPVSGAYYGECMTQKAKQKTCHALLSDMQRQLRKVPAFKNVKVTDLQSKQLWQSVKQAYQRAVFDHV